ncbi:unnamed protein product [Arabidopsis thaliana]|uniref:F-box domain-containing protein n=1 Tax=Arabidopsis thaliana TaxID=3702 RepID=A0A5S9YBY4_ARATH|nr:unnamed protein product [Arabidopsis thaliana]
MQRQRANDTVTTFRYNTRSSSRHGISNTLRVVESTTSASSPRVRRWRKKVSDDRRSTNSDLLPMDLIKEILKRLPAKTLARFLCVSKLWSSIIRSRDLMKLFLTESSARPGRLFFTFRRKDDCFLFSSEESSVATYLFTIPASGYTNNCSFVHGLICYGTTAYASQLVVYNSSTRRSITLPEIDARSFVLKHLLGYDPIDGVYKVLCMTVPRLVLQKKKKLRNKLFLLQDKPLPVIQVLTLGTGNSWKMIEDPYSQLPMNSQICINGVLYYQARAEPDLEQLSFMSFDVRSETFDLIKGPGNDYRPDDYVSTMTSYQGKLAIVSHEFSVDGASMVLWVLEKHEWLKKNFVLPNSWTSSHFLTYHCFVNVTDAGELILAPISLPDPPYYVIYYDPQRQSTRKVVIQGITEHNRVLSYVATLVFHSEFVIYNISCLVVYIELLLKQTPGKFKSESILILSLDRLVINKLFSIRLLDPS